MALANQTPVFLHYYDVIAVHGLSGLVAKLCLAGGLALVFLGNRRPGQQLLSAIIAVQGLAAFFTFWDVPVMRPVAIVGVLIAACAGMQALQPEGQWHIRTESGWRRWAVIFLLLWTWVLPTFLVSYGPGSILKALFFSPTGVFPHAIAYVLLALVIASQADSPRLPSWAGVAAAIILGLFDIISGRLWSSSVLLIGAAAAGHTLYRNVARVGVLEDDEPISDQQAREQSKRRWKREEKDALQGGKKYRIK